MAGDILCNPELGDTLGAIRRGGADAFYTGEIAERIVRTLNRGGNAMNLEDLAEHRTEATVPLRIPWNGGELLAHPPNSQAALLLLGAGMLENDRGADEPRWHHLAVEAMKRAMAIRDATFRDPAFHGMRSGTVASVRCSARSSRFIAFPPRFSVRTMRSAISPV